MPYLERVTKAGMTIEVERYYSSRYRRKGIERGDRVKTTREEQKKVNRGNAERKLRILMNANFGYGDYHVVLDYIREKGREERSKEQMEKEIAVFLRECRKEYRKQGKELKYIHVMEVGSKGARHHHLIINKLDPEILQRAWYKACDQHTRVKVFPLDDSGNYGRLAAYFIKYTDAHRTEAEGALMKKRWNCSRNLYRPEPTVRVISSRDAFRMDPTERKGYYVDKRSVSAGVVSPEYYGYGYLRYTLVELPEKGAGSDRRRQKANGRVDEKKQGEPEKA